MNQFHTVKSSTKTSYVGVNGRATPRCECKECLAGRSLQKDTRMVLGHPGHGF